MLKEQILNFTSIIGCTLALGAFFDQVLIKKEQRSQISSLLKTPRQDVQFHSAFYRYINLINDSVFAKFFSAPFFSIKYFISTSLLSTFFLAVVLAFQFAFSPATFASIADSAPQRWALVICFISNLLIDWVSIGQTQAFFKISAKLKDIRESALLIVSDFILTINFFVLIFAVVLAVMIHWADSKIITAPFKAMTTTSKLAHSDSNFASVTGNRFNPVWQSDYFLQSTNKEIAATGHLTIYSDSDQITLRDAINLSSPATGIRAWGYSAPMEEPPYQLKVFPKQVIDRAKAGKIKRGSPEWKQLTDNYWKEVPTLTIMADTNPAGWAKNLAYTVGFKEAEAMQEGFPEVIQSNAVLVKIGTLLANYSTIRSNYIWPVIYACTPNKDGENWQISSKISVFDGPCKRHVTLIPSEFSSLSADMRWQPGTWAAVKVPLNTLFMTSMIMTFLIYAFTLFLIVAKFLSTTFLAHLWLFEPVFAKAPLSSAGVVIGIVLYFITLV